MDIKEFFLLSHARSHSGRLVDTDGNMSFYEDRAVSKLTEDQLRLRPQGLNSIAWILWHVARTEDVAANVVIAGRRQVLDEDDWPSRLRVTRRDIGTGMTPEQVGELSAAVDIPSVRAYRLAVGRRTREIVTALRAEAWDTPIDRARIDRGFAEGAFLPDAKWPYTFWGDGTVGWLLSWPCLGHNNMHMGQAMWVRKLVLSSK